MALEVTEIKVKDKITVGTQEITSAVTSVGGTGTVAGLSLSGTVTTTGNLTLGGTLSTPISTINDSTTVGQNLVKLTNPSAISFIRINANNTVDALTDANFRTAIGAGTSSTTGTVTGVTGTAPIVSSGGTAPAISISAATTSAAGSMSSADKTKLDGIASGATANTGTVTSVATSGTVSGITLTGGTITTTGTVTLGGTLAVLPSNFASQTANTFLAAPNGTAGVPTFRTIVAADVPTLNQNTTGSADSANFLINNTTGFSNANNIFKGGVYSYYNGTNVPAGDFGLISIPTWTSTSATHKYNLQIGANIGGSLNYRTTDIDGAGTWKTVWDGTNLTNLNQLTNGPGYITSSGTAANVSGTVAIANGGTGATSVTQGGIIYGSSTTAYASTAVGTAGQVLTSNGTAAPTWSTVSGSGTVTSVGLTAGTGISLSGTNPITSSGTITVTNSAPDQTVALTGAGLVSTSGTYPNFTITGNADSNKLSLTGGTLTGTLTVDTPADFDQTAITSLTSAPIVVPQVNIGSTNTFLPFLHQTAVYTSGYITHMNLGLFKQASGWGDGETGFYVGLGGSDSNPTQFYKMTYGGAIKWINNSGTTYTFWSNANHGSGSGLDADLLDGHQLDTASTANTVVERDGSAHIYSNAFRTDSTNSLYKSGNRLMIRSESVDNVVEFASYGMYLPKTGETAGLYVESPIEARTGIRLGANAAQGTIIPTAWAGGGSYPGFSFTGGNTRFGFSSSSGVVDVYADGNFYATDSSHLVWHAGNLTNLNQLTNGPGYITSDSTKLPLDGGTITLASGTTSNGIYFNTAQTYLGPRLRGSGLNLQRNYYTESYTIWDAGNDGAGSGLDADLLDGIQSSSFVQTTGTQTIDGQKTFSSSVRAPDGLVGTPGITFGSDTNTGFYRSTADQIRVALGGVERIVLREGSTSVGGITFNTPASSGTFAMEFRYNGVSNSGEITVSSSNTTAYVTSSDYRLKKDVVDMDGPLTLSKIMRVKPREFTWLSDGKRTEGFIAHELQEEFPDAVIGIKDATIDFGNILDSEGNIVETNYDYSEGLEESLLQENRTWVKVGTRNVNQGTDTSFMVAALVKSIQEQQRIIESQNSSILSLKQLLVSKGILTQEEAFNESSEQ